MGAGCCKEEAIDFNGESKGAFGKVRVVQHKRSKEIYALKYINKAKCIRMRAIENIIQERRLLEEVEFPLICNLRYAFQDDENLFMVLDLMLGGDLRFHLERAGPMREDVVRFYVAELALALNALHSRRVIHRDLKPDNILLDEHGHAHLTDFNIAVCFNPSKPLLSIAGSMAYMAPEVLLRKGYLSSVDWWSLGVIAFELLFGKRPFRGKSNDLLTNSILRDPLPFPDNVHEIVSPNCIDALTKLCERDISKRLGCTPDGLDGFKKHPWFSGIDWDMLVSKQATPPFQPDSKRANFDATHELEELLMEDNPLKAKKRAQTSPETELSAEMQLMEDKFTIYDFTKVKRSTSLNRGRILRPTNDSKMNSGTLDGVVSRTTTARIDTPPFPTKIYRPDSPSDRVGQDRYRPDDDHAHAGAGYKRSPLNTPPSHSPKNNQGSIEYQKKPESEKDGYFELQNQSLSDLLKSEPIALPPTSLPRPLNRDNNNGRSNPAQPFSNSSVSTAVSTPTSPNSVQSSYATPQSSYNYTSSPTMQKSSHQQNPPQGASLFSSPSSYSDDTNDIPLQDSSLGSPVSRRAVRGRESSGMNVNSMPPSTSSYSNNPRLASAYNNGSNSYRGSEAGGRQSQRSNQYQDQLMRPSSAYTANSSSTMNDGSSVVRAGYQRPPAPARQDDKNNMYR